MMSSFRAILATTVALTFVGTAANATPTAVTSVFANGGATATKPDSVTVGAGSVWVEYGNGANSTGAGGSSTIVRYSPNGQVQNTFSIAGSVDGLRYNKATNSVWALQNQDGNSHLTIIDAATNATTPVSYALTSPSMGYDDVAFRGKQAFLSYTNPAAPTDPVILKVINGTSPIQVTTVLSDASPTGGLNTTDPDSLVLAPNGDLIQSSGDNGILTFVHNPGLASQTARYLQLTSGGVAVSGLDDTQSITAKSGTLYLTDTNSNNVLSIALTGLTPGTLLANIGSLNALSFVDPSTGAVTPFIANLNAPHGLAFVPTAAVPEPATLGLVLAGVLAARRRFRTC